MKKQKTADGNHLREKMRLKLTRLEERRVLDEELPLVLGGDPPDDQTGSTGGCTCASATTASLFEKPPI